MVISSALMKNSKCSHSGLNLWHIDWALIFRKPKILVIYVLSYTQLYFRWKETGVEYHEGKKCKKI